MAFWDWGLLATTTCIKVENQRKKFKFGHSRNRKTKIWSGICKGSVPAWARNVDTRDRPEPERSKTCKAQARPKLKKLAHHYLKSWVNIIYNCMFSNFTVIPAEPRWAACGLPEARMSLNDIRFKSNLVFLTLGTPWQMPIGCTQWANFLDSWVIFKIWRWIKHFVIFKRF